MSVTDMLHWWNLIYVVPLLVSVAWILTSVFSGAHGHASHGGSHAAGHHLGELGHHVAHSVGHAVHHGDVGHAHDGGHQSHSHGSHESSPSRIIMLLGLGQVPITLLIGVFLLCWGAFGLLSNQFFGILKYPPIFIWPSLAVTFVASATITRSMAAIVGRMIPQEETYGVSRAELCGSLGKTVYAVSESAGTVDIKDRFGTVHRVQAKVEKKEESIPAGSDVIVVDFDDEDKRFIVRQGSV